MISRLITLGLLACIGSSFAEQVPEVLELSPEKQAAADYRAIFEHYRQLEDSLETSVFDLQCPDCSDANPGAIERDQLLFQLELQPIFEQLQAMQGVPEVDFGLLDKLKAEGPWSSLGYIPEASGIGSAANWYAGQICAEQPDAALDAIFSGISLVRHQDQEPTLLTHLTQIGRGNLLNARLAEFGPEMTPQQRASVQSRIQALPAAGHLADALLAERDMFVGWYQQRILKALEAWESENLGPNDFRFPQDLRLAGVVLLPDTPVRISLQNTRTQQSFWLEKGKEVQGIELDKVDRNAVRAWIRKGDRTAIVDLQKQTIENRHVPWEVIYKAMGDNYSEDSVEALKENYIEMGFTPDEILDQLDVVYDYYTEAALRVHLSPEDMKAWVRGQLAGVSEDSYFGMVAPTISNLNEFERGTQLRQQALSDGFDLLDLQKGEAINAGSVTVNEHDYQVERTEDGFWLIPEALRETEDPKRFSLHFGTPPEEDEEEGEL